MRRSARRLDRSHGRRRQWRTYASNRGLARREACGFFEGFPDDQRCLAYQRLTTNHVGVASLRGGGGVFDLEDDAGNTVRVNAEHLVIVGEEGEGTLVPSGAMIEVLGEARVVVAEDVLASSQRATPRIVEIYGTADVPLALHVTAPAPAPATATKVRVNAAREASEVTENDDASHADDARPTARHTR